MLKDEFYKGSGKGGGDEEDDALAGKAFKRSVKIKANELISKEPY